MLMRLRCPVVQWQSCYRAASTATSRPTLPEVEPIASTSGASSKAPPLSPPPPLAATVSARPRKTRAGRAPEPKPSIEKATSGSQPRKKSPRGPRTADSTPLSLLEQIRTASPKEYDPDGRPRPFNAAAIEAHNKAVSNVLRAGAKTRLSNHDQHQLAFHEGWRPLRLSGQGGRPEPQALAGVLRIAGEALSALDHAGTEAKDWAAVRELAVFLAGEDGMPGLAAFCWRQIAHPSGAHRVVHLFANLSHDMLALREARDAPDARSRRVERFSIAPSLVPGNVLAALVAAHAVLSHSYPTTSPSASLLLPNLLIAPPGLKYCRLPPKPEGLAQRHNVTLPLEARADVSAWMRQAELAQSWVLQPNGLAVLKHAVRLLRRADYAGVQALWDTLRDSVDGRAAWLPLDDWDVSGTQRWIISPSNPEVGEEDAEDQKGVESLTATDATGRTDGEPGEASAQPSAPVDGVSATDATALVEPRLRQSHVALFVRHLTRSERYEQASAIWSWLTQHEPPMKPGVILWTALFSGYAQRGDVSALEAAWDQMTASGVVADVWAWTDLAAAHFVKRDVYGGMRVVDTMLSAPELAVAWRDEYDRSMVLNRLLAAILDAGFLVEAKELVSRVESRGVPIRTNTVNLFLRHFDRPSKPDFGGIVETIKFMGERGLAPDVVTFTTVLNSLHKAGTRDATVRMMKIMEQSGVRPSLVTYGAIINALAATGTPANLTSALQLLDELEKLGMPTNEKIYTSIIQGFLRGMASNPVPHADERTTTDAPHPYFAAALQLKDRMVQRRIPLNRIGYHSIIAAALSLESEWGINLGLRTFRELQEATRLRLHGIDDAVVEKSGARGPITHADSWYLLINGFVKMGDWHTARELVREMEASGFDYSRQGLLSRLVKQVRRGGQWI